MGKVFVTSFFNSELKAKKEREKSVAIAAKKQKSKERKTSSEKLLFALQRQKFTIHQSKREPIN